MGRTGRRTDFVEIAEAFTVSPTSRVGLASLARAYESEGFVTRVVERATEDRVWVYVLLVDAWNRAIVPVIFRRWMRSRAACRAVKPLGLLSER